MRRIVVAALVIAIASCDATTAPAAIPANPDDVMFVTADITHFWNAYDAGGKNGDTAAFRRIYFDSASSGLKDFISSRALTPLRLAQMVQAYPRYFASIRATNLRYTANDAVVTRVRANFTAIKALYPPAVFPPVTFLVGRFSSGGTTAASGMLIGTEFYSLAPGTPTDELTPFARDNVHALDSIPMIIAHEHTHILQAHAGGIFGKRNATLLEQSLTEGSADFVGELVSGGNINARIVAYGLAHEADVWADFRTQMNGTDVSRWLYNQGTATGDRPGDLGYFVGYRIAKAYYDGMSDKAQALKDIIEVRDATAFLTRSGYNPGG